MSLETAQVPGPQPRSRSPAWRRLRGVGGVLVSLVLTMLGLLLVTFIIGRVMPIDPVLKVVGERATQAQYDAARQAMGLDQPLVIQFLRYIGDVLQGDFGRSISTGHPVAEDLRRVFPATLELASLGTLIGVVIGVPLGVVAAANRGRWIDQVARVVALVGYSVPIFWLGLMGLLVFYGILGWVGYFSLAYISRMTRSFMLEQLSAEYITTARVKGLPEWRVVWGHAFRNIAIPLITVIALSFGSLLEGSVLTEIIFSWPGIGSYITKALLAGDMNAVLGGTVVVGTCFVVLNLLSDILYRVLDPRSK